MHLGKVYSGWNCLTCSIGACRETFRLIGKDRQKSMLRIAPISSTLCLYATIWQLNVFLLAGKDNLRLLLKLWILSCFLDPCIPTKTFFIRISRFNWFIFNGFSFLISLKETRCRENKFSNKFDEILLSKNFVMYSCSLNTEIN